MSSRSVSDIQTGAEGEAMRHERETVKHFFFLCPRFAAQRDKPLTSAAQVCVDWRATTMKNLNIF